MSRRPLCVTIIGGAGFMGKRIGGELCLAGCDVVLYDRSNEDLKEALKTVKAELGMLYQRGLIFPEDVGCIEEHMRTSLDIGSAVAGADIVLECVPEDASLKARIFKDVERHAPLSCVFATNTMQLSVTSIAKTLADPSRLVGIRFLHPVYLIDSVEVTAGVDTTPEVLERVKSMLLGLGKETHFREPGQNAFHKIAHEDGPQLQKEGARKRNERLHLVSPSTTEEPVADDGDDCVVCMAAPKCMAVDPCGHICLCEDCAHELRTTSNQCPICRRTITSVLKTFRS